MTSKLPINQELTLEEKQETMESAEKLYSMLKACARLNELMMIQMKHDSDLGVNAMTDSEFTQEVFAGFKAVFDANFIIMTANGAVDPANWNLESCLVMLGKFNEMISRTVNAVWPLIKQKMGE